MIASSYLQAKPMADVEWQPLPALWPQPAIWTDVGELMLFTIFLDMMHRKVAARPDPYRQDIHQR
jgi:hypothetical protein